MMSPRSFLFSRQNQRHTPSSTATAVPASSSYLPASLVKRNYEQHQTNPYSSVTSTNSPYKTTSTMATSKLRPSLSPSPSPPNRGTRSPTATSPVQIPAVPKSRETAHPQKKHRQHGSRRHLSDARPRDVHSPDAIPASVAALLAVTSIPSRRGSKSHKQRRAPSEKRMMTVDSIIERSQETEKEFSSSLSWGRSPMDMLLSAPEDLDIDDVSIGESTLGSPLSTWTVSMESVPSLDDSFTTSDFSSVETPTSSPRSRKAQPMRRPLESISIPGEKDYHPLASSPRLGVEEMDFRVFQDSSPPDKEPGARLPFKPLKSAFKSNLTASLRALRQAARSFSSLNLTSIPPEDFLTRSILTIDPRVPYTDERRPPPLEEEPTPALRRYFNPTTNARLEQPPLASPVTGPDFTASIQMQTYKVQRARSASPSSRIPRPSSAAPGGKSGSVVEAGREQKTVPLEPAMPGPRQREMRENSDFIRIAVMEMAMRKRGKLDDQRPGRARWALPPRKVSPKPYKVGNDGVPARWVAVTY